MTVSKTIFFLFGTQHLNGEKVEVKETNYLEEHVADSQLSWSLVF